MKTNRNSIIMYIIYDTFKNDVTKEIEKNNTHKSKIPSDFIAKFYLGSIFSIGIEILENTKKIYKRRINRIFKYQKTIKKNKINIQINRVF